MSTQRAGEACRKQASWYSRTCSSEREEQRANREGSGSPHVLLFSAPDVQSCSFSILLKASVLEQQHFLLFLMPKMAVYHLGSAHNGSSAHEATIHAFITAFLTVYILSLSAFPCWEKACIKCSSALILIYLFYARLSLWPLDFLKSCASFCAWQHVDLTVLLLGKIKNAKCSCALLCTEMKNS